jgi:hypothetical protein
MRTAENICMGSRAVPHHFHGRGRGGGRCRSGSPHPAKRSRRNKGLEKACAREAEPWLERERRPRACRIAASVTKLPRLHRAGRRAGVGNSQSQSGEDAGLVENIDGGGRPRGVCCSPLLVWEPGPEHR